MSSELKTNIKQYLSIYETIKGPNKFTYMSCSISTGPRFIEWYARIGKNLDPISEEYKKSHEENVINKNIQDAINLAEGLRELTGEYIINPAVIDLPLTNEEYMLFWTETIKKYIDKIVFAPGWELSKGALAEFLTAKTKKLPCFDIKLQPISTKEAIDILHTSTIYLDNLGLKSDYQQNILRLLKNI